MATQPAPDVAQVDIIMTRDAQELRNILHVYNPAGWDNTTLGALAAAVIEQWETNWKIAIPAEVSLVQVICTDLTSLDGQRVTTQVVPPVPGTASGAALPANCTLAVKLSIAKRGRGAQGRLFWPSLSEAQVTDNEVSSDAIQDIIDAVDLMQAGIEALGTGYQMVVLHRYKDGVKLATATHDQIIGAGVTDVIVDSQKDRLPAHKAHRRTTP